MMLLRQAKNTHCKIRNIFSANFAIEKYLTVDVQVQQNQELFENYDNIVNCLAKTTWTILEGNSCFSVIKGYAFAY